MSFTALIQYNCAQPVVDCKAEGLLTLSHSSRGSLAEHSHSLYLAAVDSLPPGNDSLASERAQTRREGSTHETRHPITRHPVAGGVDVGGASEKGTVVRLTDSAVARDSLLLAAVGGWACCCCCCWQWCWQWWVTLNLLAIRSLIGASSKSFICCSGGESGGGESTGETACAPSTTGNQRQEE